MSSYPRPLPTPPPLTPLTNNNNSLPNSPSLEGNYRNLNNSSPSTSSTAIIPSILNNSSSAIRQSSPNNHNQQQHNNNIINQSQQQVQSSNESIVCNGCKLGLEEASDAVVVSFGERLWHVDCRCAKCQNLVEHDTNLLLLSDGSPVCENCSYICSVCQSPISNEAIVTGDESYHADCFRCRSCTNKIEELIFAKTSQGIWCMACHNERVARSRKHAEAKRSRSSRKEKERTGSSSSAVGNGSSSSRRNTLNELESDMLPPPPPLPSISSTSNAVQSSSSNSNYYDANSRSSISSNYSSLPSTSTSLSTLSSEPSLNHISSPRRHRVGGPPPTSYQLPLNPSSSSSALPPPPPKTPTTPYDSLPSSPLPLNSPLLRSNSPLSSSQANSPHNYNTSFQQQQQQQQQHQQQQDRVPNSPNGQNQNQFNFTSPRMGTTTLGSDNGNNSRPTTADLNSLPRSPATNLNVNVNGTGNESQLISPSSPHLSNSLSINSNSSNNTLTTSSSNSLSTSPNRGIGSISSNGNLSASSGITGNDKSLSSNKNRRSGFYGNNQQLGGSGSGNGSHNGGSGAEDGEEGEGIPGSEDNTAVFNSDDRRSPRFNSPSPSMTARPFTPPPPLTTPHSPLPSTSSSTNLTSHSESTQSFLPELHTSISFYDPDTLLFLDHVNSVPNSPKVTLPLTTSTQSNQSNLSNIPTRKRASSIIPSSTLIVEHVIKEDLEDEPEVEETGTVDDLESRKNHGPDSDLDELPEDELLSLEEEEINDGLDHSLVEGDGRPKSLVATRLRESIRKSRDGEALLLQGEEHLNSNSISGGGGSSGMNMDVDLVEMLLGELDGTKMEMRDLQGKYSAFRRASRSAFEGFSMAREEYDKEVIARKEAESKMDQLKIKLTEQALTLAAVDKEQKTAEALKRQSTELRSSVVGMERHLSQLRAEVELSTAQVEELTSIDSEDLSNTADGANVPVVNHLDIAKSLNARLENVKDEHRRQIELLIQQKDELIKEVSELKITRDNYIEETVSLNSKKLQLIELNVEASKQLELTREATSRFRAVSPSSTKNTESSTHNSSLISHQYTPSSSSTLLSSSSHQNPTSSTSSISRSPLAPSRIAAPPSPATTIDYNQQQHAIESVRRIKPEEQITSSQVAKKFKWGKGKTTTEVPRSSNQNNNSNNNNGNNSNSNNNLLNLTGSPSSKTPPPSRSGLTSNNNNSNNNSNNGNETRTHSFQQTSILRPVRCEYCGDKMWGLNEVRCTTCGSYSHAKCAGYLQGSCNTHGSNGPHEEIISGNPNGLVMFGTDLTTQTRVEDRQVPIVVTKCIAAVETYGMNYEGIYRKTGGTGQVRLITQYFERGQDFDLEDLDKFNDLAAVTSCMKNFFRTLPDPLFTHELHEEFVSCVSQPEGETRLNLLEITLYKLPEAHFFTALALMSHLHRVHLRSSENKMTPANLGVVFGPTVLRSITPSREFSDMGFKAKIVELMVENQPRLFAKSYHSSSN